MMKNTCCDHFYNKWLMVHICFSFSLFALARCLCCVNDLYSETPFQKCFPFFLKTGQLYQNMQLQQFRSALRNCCVILKTQLQVKNSTLLILRFLEMAFPSTMKLFKTYMPCLSFQRTLMYVDPEFAKCFLCMKGT